MTKPHVFFVFLMVASFSWAQEITLPPDFRQHNLTQFNANLLNSTYSLDWNTPNSFSVWSRWQWQTIDGDPTSLFANYTHQFNQKSVLGIGLLQHNTGVFLNTGANLNYVYAFSLDDTMKLVVGTNVAAFSKELADDRFDLNPDIDLPQLENSSEFIMQFSPAVRLQINRFSVGLAVENAIYLNLSDSGSESSEDESIFTGTLSNDFPLALFPGLDNSFVRPMIYVRAIPNADTQFGINGLLSTSKFWLQGGYNNFYGISGGAGVTFARKFSIGGLLEFGTDSVLDNEDPTLELIASYHFGKSNKRKKVAEVDKEQEKRDAIEEQKLAEAKEAEKREKEQQLKLAEEKRLETERQQQLLAEQAKVQDSIAKVRLIAKELLDEQRKRDSIAELQREKIEVKPNEKYEEIAKAEGLEPGFYLIANVFGTKHYFESFMLTLKKKGLEPKSFYRSLNKFNYVYLQRYNTMQEARKARDSKFFGKYPDKTWIFRVRGD
ncbi:PorP/SprF family type IX secretion system membrane protein [Flagellimonas sp.]|uniref:PorP/SprF family type IX secretion system membrane protein n=1 Tax=Flagellimonas sp. TaxID=2058762 RepID=UPI003B5BB1C3